jgi:hypothetical protein
MPKRSRSSSRGAWATEEFDAIAKKLEAFIKRHRQVRVLEVIQDFEGMDAAAFCHDVKFSLRHLHDFSRLAIVTNPDMHPLWSALVAPFMRRNVEHFPPGEVDAARALADVARGCPIFDLLRGLFGLPGRGRGLLLDRVEIFDDRLDVVGAEHEDRHVGMA